MIIAPIDFERLPPLYNPSVVMEMVSDKPQSIPKTVSALDAANPNNLKTALDQQALQSPIPNKKESVYNVPATVAVVGMDHVGESILSAEYVNLLMETQTVHVPTHIAIEAYEDAGETRRIATLIIVA